MSRISPSPTLSSSPADPTTPIYSDSLEWITAYLTVHSLSVPSQRYSFLLWIAVAFVFLCFAILHWTNCRGGYLGAVWSKWSIRRRTWRKKHALAVANRSDQPHRQLTSLPSNGQLLFLAILALASLAVAFVGPDYLAPKLKVWQFVARSSPQQLYDISTFEPYAPQYTIRKSLWSSSARTGQIAFALFPLCVLFALKAPPFAIFAIPFMIQLHFDKLAWLHRWSGRLIWLLTSIHVVLWSIQLTKDVNPSTGRIAYVHAWSYSPFILGWIAFGLLTLITLLSIHPVRRRFYESFYVFHVLLVPTMLVTAAFHHPTVWWWCWVALGVWAAERLWRTIRWIDANGLGFRNSKTSSEDAREKEHFRHLSIERNSTQLPVDRRSLSIVSVYYEKGSISPGGAAPGSAPSPYSFAAEPTLARSTSFQKPPPYIPPPGYAHAELLSGRTVRLRLVTPMFLPWSPGQHFLLNIPAVSRLTSHPFTCASVCDEEAPAGAGRVMLFLVRAKNGWTQDLWDTVSRMTAEQSLGDVPAKSETDSQPKRGVLLRAFVDGPFGSSQRTRWGNYSTAVIITGGSGVSFGLPLLQYMCMCLSGRDGRRLGSRPGGWGRNGADLKRVRFIWLVREYSHVQWCASIIRNCTSMVDPSALQVDIFVTNFQPTPMRPPVLQAPQNAHLASNTGRKTNERQQPRRNSAHENSVHSRSKSADADSNESYESDVDLNYYLGECPEEETAADEMGVAHDTRILELTNFEGEDDTALPGEAYFNRKLQKEGKTRRLHKRRKRADRRDHDSRTPRPPSYTRDQTPPSHPHDTRQTSPEPLARLPSRRTSPSPRASRPKRRLTLSTDLPDRSFLSPLTERSLSGSSETDMNSPSSYRSDTPLHSRVPSRSTPMSPETPTLVSPVSPVTRPARDDRRRPYTADPTPSYPLVMSKVRRSRSLTPHTFFPATNANLHRMASTVTSLSVSTTLGPPEIFEMDEQEAMDVNVVSEHARTGKPKLDKVIADEVEASKGAVVVACCGPTSLNTMVRKIVAAQINPARVLKGDMRGSITLISEEFEY